MKQPPPSLRTIAISLALAGSLAACSVARDRQPVGSYVDDAETPAEDHAKMAADKEVANWRGVSPRLTRSVT